MSSRFIIHFANRDRRELPLQPGRNGRRQHDGDVYMRYCFDDYGHFAARDDERCDAFYLPPPHVFCNDENVVIRFKLLLSRFDKRFD